MADDGSGSDISIPSMLMYHTVRMEMSWALPTPNTVAEYDIFTTPTDTVSRSLIESFEIAAEALGQHAKFSPHMYIYDGMKAGYFFSILQFDSNNSDENKIKLTFTPPSPPLFYLP